MKKESLSVILQNKGITENSWTRLPFYNIIVLNVDANHYVSYNEEVFKFDNVNELLYVGAEKDINKDLTDASYQPSTIKAIYSYAAIAGLVSSSKMGPAGIFMRAY